MARLAWPRDARVALAISGGSDSLALMHLFAGWADDAALPKPMVLTVDHGLRPGSAADADSVVTAAHELGLIAHILAWSGEKPEGNIEDAAREARYRLMGEWCREHGIGALFVAHTEDDQAETFLIRLGRGSGVDGLSAMGPRAPYPLPGFALELMRPLLAFSREELRSYLEERHVAWLEDPMNADPSFTRVRLRKLLPLLAEAGVSAKRIADAAAHLRRARDALDWQVEAFLARYSSAQDTVVLFDGAALKDVPREIGLRAFSALLMRVSGGSYRPRFDRLEAAFDAVTSPAFRQARTLMGCKIGPPRKTHALFGPATVSICLESARRTIREREAPAKLKVAFPGTKLPKKGRNMALPYNS
jgi:tRNA(Ile)-lysidine synthase